MKVSRETRGDYEQKSRKRIYIYIGNINDVNSLLQLGQQLLAEEKSLTYKWNMDQQQITTTIISAAPFKDGTAAYSIVFYDINFVEK